MCKKRRHFAFLPYVTPQHSRVHDLLGHWEANIVLSLKRGEWEASGSGRFAKCANGTACLEIVLCTQKKQKLSSVVKRSFAQRMKTDERRRSGQPQSAHHPSDSVSLYHHGNYRAATEQLLKKQQIANNRRPTRALYFSYDGLPENHCTVRLIPSATSTTGTKPSAVRATVRSACEWRISP